MKNNDLLNYEDEITCPNCQGLGRIKKSGELLTPKVNMDEMEIYELSVEEFKKLMVECFGMLKQLELDTSIKAYDAVVTGNKPFRKEIKENLQDFINE